MKAAANEITILPGSRIQFTDCDSSQTFTVVLEEALKVQATKKTTVTVIDISDGEQIYEEGEVLDVT